MKQTYDRALKEVLVHEGGYVDHPSDPGGATNRGITRATLAAWRGVSPVTALPKSEVKNLSMEETASIYRANYWNKVKGDDLLAGIDYSTFDYAVNSGVSRGAKSLQKILQVKVDGVIGRQTLDALGNKDGGALVKKQCAERLSFLQSLKIWNTFGKGWSRRVASVEALGVKLWLDFKGLANQPELLREDAKSAEHDASQKTTTSATTGTTAGAGGVSEATTDWSQVMGPNGRWILLAIVIALAIAAIWFFIRGRADIQRASAYRSVANGVHPITGEPV